MGLDYLNPETRHLEVEKMRRHAAELRRQSNYELDGVKRQQMRTLAHDIETQLRDLGRPNCR